MTGAAVHWFGQFLGAEEPAKRVAMPFRTADVTLVPEASVGVEWRARLASEPTLKPLNPPRKW